MSSMNEVAQTSDQVEIRVRLLGAVEVTDRHGEVLDLGPDKCRAVLAALALSAGAVVPVSRIVALVWGAEPPRTADKTLQSYVTRLRKVLGPDSIQRSGAAYRLQLLPGAVDAARFQQRLDDGDLAGALTEWRGLPLAGLDTGGFGATIDGLVEQWLGAVEEELAAQVDRDASAAIGPLTELVADHPFREGLWALLMTALYRVGRQADALAAYRRARRHLVEELGVEPGPRLRALEASILDHDDRLGAGRRPAEDGAVPTGTVTFGFVDVVGAAGLWSERRREIGRALGRIDDVVRAAVEEVGGHVFSAGGESYGVAFHRPTEAASWADAVQGGVRAIDETDRLGLSVRIGLHTGETEERARGYFGPAVNLAASLAAIGNDGQTLVSGATAAMLGSSGLRPLGRYRLDGVVNDQRVHQLGGGEHPPLRTERSRRGNLPRSVGRLLGRDDAVAAVSAALRTAPAVTLVGPGGIGKTRLALAAAGAAADDVDDGVWLVELAGIASSEDVARAAADVLGVAERAGRPLIESIVTALGPRRLLLVLDNCEHVIDGAAELTDAIGRSCPAVRVLATSREGLGCDGEQLVVVPPLDPAGPGVDLFIERAAAVGGSFDPGADRARIEEVCRRLDGVPLAIELAAARTRTLSPADLVDRLDDRLRLLTGGRRTSVERHRTLRATLQWSYELLAPADQALFRRLSVFAGPFDLAAAEMVAADPPTAERVPERFGVDIDDVERVDLAVVGDLLGALVDRSMVIVESGPFGRRFRLLETMRQFGAELLHDAGDTDRVAARHARWCLDQVESIHLQLIGQEEPVGVGRLVELWPNLRAGFDWACAVGDARLAYRLVRPVAAEVMLRAQGEIGAWLERILAMDDAGPTIEPGPAPVGPDHGGPLPDDGSDVDERVAFCLLWAAHGYAITQNHDAFDRLVAANGSPDHPWVRFGRAFLYEDVDELGEWGPVASAAALAAGQPHAAELLTLGGSGQSLISQHRFQELDRFAGELAARYRRTGPPTLLNFALIMGGYSAVLQGREADGEVLFTEAAAVDTPDRTLGVDQWVEAQSALRRGEPIRAKELLAGHVEILLDSDNLYQARMACVEFVNVMVTLDRHDLARPVLAYLYRPDLLDIELSRSLVSADARVDELTDDDRAWALDVDARGILLHMREVLRADD